MVKEGENENATQIVVKILQSANSKTNKWKKGETDTMRQETEKRMVDSLKFTCVFESLKFWIKCAHIQIPYTKLNM